MNVLVVGCGRLGRRLAEQLDGHGDDVVIIDSNADNFRMLDENFNGMTVTGFPMDMKALRSAGIESCDAVAVCTPDDNLNITISQIALEFFHVQNVVARISDPGRERVFKNFRLKSVCHTKLACDAIFTALTQPYDAKDLSFGTATVAFHIRDAERQYIGANAAMVPPEEGETLFGVIRADGAMLLAGEGRKLILEENDRVVFALVAD